jgi:peptidyl-prolyl cis-trans isomerase D
MLQKMRDQAQGPLAKVIVFTIILVLGLFGFGAFNIFTVSEPAVASVNGVDISERELLSEIEREKRQLQQQYPGLDAELIDSVVNPEQAIDRLITQELVDQTTEELSLSSSSKEYLRQIRMEPAFQTDGVFDENLFRRTIDDLGYSPATFRVEMGRTSKAKQLSEAVTASSFLTEREVKLAAVIRKQTRDIAYLLFDGSALTDEVSVDDEEIENHYVLNIDSYETEEQFSFGYVTISSDLLRSRVDITQEQIESAYQIEIDSLGTERKRVAHILLTLDGERDATVAKNELNALKERIELGESFSVLATAISEEEFTAEKGGDLGYLDRGTFPYFDNVADGLQVGEISLPFETQYGMHLLTVTEVEEVIHPAFEERSDDLKNMLIDREVDLLFRETLTQMDKLAFEQNTSLEPVSAINDIEIQIIEGITRSGGPAPFDQPNVINALLDSDVIDNGNNTAVIMIADSEAMVARLETRVPSRQLPLESVKDDIQGFLINQKADRKSSALAESVVADIESDKAVGEIAAFHGKEWTRVDAASWGVEDVPRLLVAKAYELPAPGPGHLSAGYVDLSDGTHAAVVVSKVELGDYAATTEAERTALTGEMEDIAGQLDMNGFLQTLRQSASVDTSYSRETPEG